MEYSLHFQDFRGRVFSTAQLSATDDDEAIDVARRIYRTGFGSGYQIQCHGRLVHTEDATTQLRGLTH